ncbi:MAG: phosphotransferase, partial [Acidobacteriota bacterium]|nr:phosphotransferase [Acidobacteriota bacterium]
MAAELHSGNSVADLKQAEIKRYLDALLGVPITISGITILGSGGTSDVKAYGYGIPVKIDYRTNSENRTAVLHTIKPGPFGHELMADRARELLWAHSAFNRLPRHLRSIDVGGFQTDGRLITLGETEELFLLSEYLEGESYSHDLERLRDADTLTDPDLARADALCDYLVGIHSTRGCQPGLYTRRIRELVGDGECVMGVTDSYPPHPLFSAAFLEKVEHLCVTWRWRLRDCTHRLRQVHGDFHPWNILFRTGSDFSLLDRSRGEYGDPTDDVTSLTLNYV